MKKIVGLDIETSGADNTNPKHRVIQIGVAFGTMAVVSRNVGWARDEFEAEPTATGVHGISEDEVVLAPSAERVDGQVAEWIGERGVGHGDLIATGWNVGSFDLPFVKRDLPETAKYVSRRTIDLNALCFALSQASAHNFDWWKKEAKRAAVRVLGLEKWHDAGYDAAAALASFLWITEQLRPRDWTFKQN